ncbi:hypothetical protein FSP39_023319 [Pinctada imbricata]|uniref:Myeloid differentiation factor 88 n=1 Tax=Pinctada imbricata TaxID=66713 RepID=A0AA88YT45_PINIB|nr:hypothetical protein FSP39_023319 [Pinctada imbricata]
MTSAHARSSLDSLVIVTESGGECCLPDRFMHISLDALNHSARRKIALHMNLESDVPSDRNHLVSDYNGLAELIGFQYLEIKNFERQKSPTEELLKEWCTRPDLEEPTLGKLWDFLVQLGRVDVLEECQQMIIRDAEAYLKMKERMHNDYAPLQSNDVDSSSDGAIDHHIDETLVLCRADVTLGEPQHFDAFVCYNPEGEDLKFVKQMISVLENEPHNLKLFVPWRDDLPGGSRYVIDAKLIESRCRRMVIIMSRNYQNSAACDFQVKFAHALSPGARSKKLIPVLIEPGVMIPQVLRHVTLCDFTKRDLMDWFWDRLSKAIRAPLDPRNMTTFHKSSSSTSSSLSSSSLSSAIDIPMEMGLGFNASSHSDVRESLSSYQSSRSSTTDPDSGFSSLSPSNSSQQSISSSYSSFQEAGIEAPMETDPPPEENRTSRKKKTGFFDRLRGKKNNTSSHC